MPTLGTEERAIRVAIVGSGPAGFYAAIALIKNKEHVVHVDLFDRLPTPYGLVRGGVAPDHQKIKAVTRVYEKQISNPKLRFFGNVELGSDISVDDLTAHYDQILYASGAAAGRALGIPGEDLDGVIPSPRVVSWYNGHPDERDLNVDLSGKRIAVIGNGNVAVDVVRILAKTENELKSSDIATHALEAIANSKVEEIYMIGRRGPVQAQFTPVEVKELGELEATDPVVGDDVLALDEHSKAWLENDAPKHVHRNMSLLTEFAARELRPGVKKLHFRFLESPIEILGDENGKVRAVKLRKNKLIKKDDGSIRPQPTDEVVELEVDAIYSAIGFVGLPVPGVPFNADWKCVASEDGRIVNRGEVVPNQYVVGWAQTGAKGLLGPHKGLSATMAKKMLSDREGIVDRALPDREAICALLKERNVKVVTFADWQKLDQYEKEMGKERGAPRIKVARVAEMLDIMGV